MLFFRKILRTYLMDDPFRKSQTIHALFLQKILMRDVEVPIQGLHRGEK